MSGEEHVIKSMVKNLTQGDKRRLSSIKNVSFFSLIDAGSHNPFFWVLVRTLSSPTDVGSHNLPLEGPPSSLAHHPMSDFDTIYNVTAQPTCSL